MYFPPPDDASGAADARRPNESLAWNIDEVPAVIWTTDAALRILTMKGAVRQILHLAPEELIGRTIAELLPDYGSPAQPLEAYRQALAGKTQAFVWLDQKRRIQCRLAPRRDAAGVVIGVIGVAVEIGEPITMDGGYRLLFENHPLAMWVFDAETLRFLTVNQAAINQYGYSRDEFLAMTIEGLWDEPSHDRRKKYRPIADLGIASAGLWKHRRKDGSLLDVEIFYTELSLGQRGAWLVLAPNVTQRIAAEESLAESKRQLRSLFESPAMGVVYWGPDGEILDTNDTFLQILGHTRDDLEQGRVLWRQIAPLPLTSLEAGGILSGAVRPLFNRQYLRPDGSSISVLVAAAEWPDGGGGMAFVIDITQRIQLEAQLLHWQKMEAIGRIAGGISHDCNNFLTVILGYAENMLRRPEISADVRADALEIQRAGNRAAAVMQQLLAFGRKQMLAPAALRLSDVVSDMDQMLRSMVGETAELRLVLDDAIDTIFADQGQIEQMIVNLIVNARDAMPSGGTITLRTANAELGQHDVARWLECEPGHYVLLSIQDTGAGMTAEVQARVFEPFFTTKQRGRGTGLGLAIVSGIVRQCHGHIMVSSEVGRGSTFTIYLPRSGHSVMPPPARTPTHSQLPTGRGTVLVVEDDPDVRMLVKKVLLGCGYEVHVAADGLEALRYLEGLAQPPRLVMTDVVMPHMNGRQLGDHVRANLPDTKVLYMTGYDDPAADSPIALRADDVILRKPFSPSNLAWTVHHLFEDAADSLLD